MIDPSGRDTVVIIARSTIAGMDIGDHSALSCTTHTKLPRTEHMNSSTSKQQSLYSCILISVAVSLLSQGLIDALNLGQILKEKYFYYELVFLAILVLSLAAYSYFLIRKNSLRAPTFLGFAAVAGYVSSIVAFYVLPLFAPHGWQRFVEPQRSSAEWVTIAWSGLVILGWLVGFLAALVAFLILRKAERGRALISLCCGVIGALFLTHRFSLLGFIFH
jgi:hypothetical protein